MTMTDEQSLRILVATLVLIALPLVWRGIKSLLRRTGATDAGPNVRG